MQCDRNNSQRMYILEEGIPLLYTDSYRILTCIKSWSLSLSVKGLCAMPRTGRLHRRVPQSFVAPEDEAISRLKTQHTYVTRSIYVQGWQTLLSYVAIVCDIREQSDLQPQDALLLHFTVTFIIQY